MISTHIFNKKFQIHHEEQTHLTGSDIRIRSIRCALALQHRGLRMGDCIGVISRNTTNLCVLIIAAFTLGTPYIALEINVSQEHTTEYFKISKPKFIFCNPCFLVQVQNTLKKLNHRARIVLIGDKVPGYDNLDSILEEYPNERTYMYVVIQIKSNY